MWKITLFFAVMLICIASCRKPVPSISSTHQKAVKWLWDQQAQDGGWHSQTHKVLADGIALTPYVLFYLLNTPDEIYKPQAKQIDNARIFVENSIRQSITFHHPENEQLNYPNYSAAYALQILMKLDGDTLLQHTVAQHLMREQFLEHRGFDRHHLVYGGWGYGETDLKPGEYGHVDISHTRRVAAALSTYFLHNEMYDELTKLIETVGVFLQGVQRSPLDDRRYEGCLSRAHLPYDGGFVASVVTLSTIKSQPIATDSAGIHYPSYATATSDGLLCMQVIGDTLSQAYADATQWLTQYQQIAVIDGLSESDPEQWTHIMHYYHWAVRAEAMRAAKISGLWTENLHKALIQEQQPDGFYINPMGGVNKEDDPLMSTIFAVQAMNSLE